jgi:hypothetical protein
MASGVRYHKLILGRLLGDTLVHKKSAATEAYDMRRAGKAFRGMAAQPHAVELSFS